MRLIGYLPDEQAADTFSDFLYVQGIVNQVESEKDGWAVWIHSEDELERAKDLLQSYIAAPGDLKYRKHARHARKLKERERKEAEAAEKRYFDRARLMRAAVPFGVGRLTLVLIVICTALWLLMLVTDAPALISAMLISNYRSGLPEILTGQVWRLFTPALLHQGILHLFFNMLWLFDLGSMIERRQGTKRLATLILVIAAISNLGQFFWAGPRFGGMSGVVYGLLGYIWMKGKHDPASGLFLHPQTVTMMMIWLVLCFTGLMGNIANAAHVVGLLVGTAWGYLSSTRR